MTMSLPWIRKPVIAPRRGVVLFALATAFAGCGLDKVDVPDVNGPSTYAFSVVATVTPDVLLADAVSTAIVQATVRGPDGNPVGGRAVFFQVTDENFNYVDLGTVQSATAPVAYPAPQVTEVTGSNGIAQVVYRVPERISVTAIQPVHILVRLVGDDFQGNSSKSVLIQLRPAEIRRFPENPDNSPPTCSFVVDPEVGPDNGFYPTNFTVRFHTTSTDNDDVGGGIVQYFWDFGDGHQDDKPDVQHHWSQPGNYPVTHIVTDNNGAIDTCFAVLGVR